MRGMGHREPAHRVGDMARLGARLLQELQARRRGEEEIAHFDPRAGRMRRGPGFALGAAVDLEAPGGVGAGRPRGDGEAADRGDRRQRLAAEAQRADVGRDRRRAAWRCSAARPRAAARRRSCRSPSSTTERKVRPPSFRVTAMRCAPASMAFSTSSFTALAGRSTTSPAAMRLTRVEGRRRRMGARSWRCQFTSARRCGKILAGQDLAVLDRGLVEGVDRPAARRRTWFPACNASSARPSPFRRAWGCG